MKGILKALAPKLLDVVASSNPVAGTVLKMATKKLGLPDNATVEQIEQEIDRNPDKVALISEVEQQVKMMDIKLEAYKTEVDDRKDAREKFSQDWFVKTFSLLLFVFFAIYVWEITHQPEEEQNMALVNLTLGNLFGLVQAVVAYYFSGSMDNGNKSKR
tara:strand:+ start:493 stop:969 length:477 start_codon:yes stop_codon:yes gene_type:complete